MGATVLVVDDDRNIMELAKLYLTKEGYTVRVASDGDEALQRIRTSPPDVVVLDIMMPGQDGYEVCKAVRKFSSVPILMLTARDDIVDKVVGFEIGADDYLTKPFNPKELAIRVKALLRRVQTQANDATSPVIERGVLKIDPGKRQVTVQGKDIDLRPKEFDLLLLLAQSPGHVFRREQLLDSVWGYEFPGYTRTVDVHIQHIRDKLAAEGARDYVQTIWGVGYKFETQGDRETP